MSEREIYSAALALQDEFGEEAVTIAAHRASGCLADGDLNECERWVRIGETIAWIEEGPSRTLH